MEGSTASQAESAKTIGKSSALYRHFWLPLLFGAACLFAAVLICAVWLRSADLALALFGHWPELGFVSALCFAATGCAIVVEARANLNHTVIFGTIMVVLALLSIAALTWSRFDLIELVIVSVLQLDPRLATLIPLHAALCFLLIGLAFAGVWRPLNTVFSRAANMLSAMIVLLISGSGIASQFYLLDSPGPWGQFTSMPLAVALALFLVAVGWLIKEGIDVRLHPDTWVNWSPLGLLLIGVLVSVFIAAQAARGQDDLYQSQMNHLVLQEAADHQRSLKRRLDELTRLATLAVNSGADITTISALLKLLQANAPELDGLALGRNDELQLVYGESQFENWLDENWLDNGGNIRTRWITGSGATAGRHLAFFGDKSEAAEYQIVGIIDVNHLIGLWLPNVIPLSRESNPYSGFLTFMKSYEPANLQLAGRSIPVALQIEQVAFPRQRAPVLIALIGLVTSALLSVLWAVLLQTLQHRRQSEHQLIQEHNNAKRLKLALSIARVGSWQWQAGQPIELDAAMAAILRTNKRSLLPEELVSLAHPDDRERLRDSLIRGLATAESFEGEFRTSPPGGPERVVESLAQSQQGIDGRATRVVGVIRDITQTRELESELRMNARTDGLTGLTNRRGFDEAMHREMASAMRNGCPLSLLLLDADYFKRLNDSAGHIAGDNTLVELANILVLALRRPPDVAARYGGEEFALILPNTDAEGAKTIARRIRIALLDKRIKHPDSPLGDYLTVSVGIAQFDPEKHHETDLLVRDADVALYAAKGAGRNSVVVFDQDQHTERAL